MSIWNAVARMALPLGEMGFKVVLNRDTAIAAMQTATTSGRVGVGKHAAIPGADHQHAALEPVLVPGSFHYEHPDHAIRRLAAGGRGVACWWGAKVVENVGPGIWH